MDSTASPLEVPYSLDLSLQYRHPFRRRYGLYHTPTDDRPLPANERNMCALSAALRSKPNWWIKYTNPEIRVKWKSEAVGAPVPFGEIPLKEDEVEYVLQELAHFALKREEETGIEASIYHRMWQSDALIPQDLDAELRRCVAQLEDVPEEAKDWHPGSNRQVLDLLHPSLYCIVYGRTLVRQLDRSQHRTAKPIDYAPWTVSRLQTQEHTVSTVVQIPKEHSRSVPHSRTAGGTKHEFLSQSFSWLPTDFGVSIDGMNAHALGYINNLDPVLHQSMYGVIERLVVRFIPLWERVLGETAAGYALPARTEDEYIRVKTREESYYDELDEDDMDWYADEGEPQLPSLFGPFNGHPKSPVVDLKDTTLQVIVKFANICLTPENPEYSGGTWHVEGMINEAIVSTGIYYYDEDNITASRLAFRAAVDEPWCYWQNDHIAAQLIWGIDRSDPLVQDIGTVVTKQGRCLAFPNVYQHQVQPFSLADRTKSGHRKIVALFLVDPHLKEPRPSTTQVLPQQQEWLRLTLREISRASSSKAKNHLARLPNELLDFVVDATGDSLMSRTQAEEYRTQLMKERSVMVQANTESMFTVGFNMCEH